MFVIAGVTKFAPSAWVAIAVVAVVVVVALRIRRYDEAVGRALALRPAHGLDLVVTTVPSTCRAGAQSAPRGLRERARRTTRERDAGVPDATTPASAETRPTSSPADAPATAQRT
jgi:hypothetical protein